MVECDDIRRFCDERQIQFIAIDSIGAACDGKLADDDVARAYNRALDHLPPSLAAAHTPKNEADDAVKPFGSVFFSNYTRMSWRLKKQIGASEDVATVLYKPGKQNDGDRLKLVALDLISHLIRLVSETWTQLPLTDSCRACHCKRAWRI
jgi:hypothetical protein